MRKLLSLILFFLLLAGTAFAGGTIQWPTACFFDSNGDPLTGGKLYSYAAGTSTNKALYSDRALTTPHTNPEILDSNGCTEVYGIGTYKLILKDSTDATTYFTDDNVTVTAQSVSYYYPNYNAADQGATGNSDTIKYAIDTCSTNDCTITLLHNSGGAKTEYVLGTSDTAGSNIKFKFENGAEIKPAATKVLTVYSPDHIAAGKQQQIIDITNNSTNPLVFTNPGAVSPDWWLENTTPGTTNMYAALNLAEASLSSGGVIKGNGETYLTSSSLTIGSDIFLDFLVQGSIIKDDGSNADLTIGGDIISGIYQIFNWGNGTGEIEFADSSPIRPGEGKI